MIDVEVKTTEPVTVAYLPMSGAYGQIPEAMGRLYGWVAQRGLQPVGMPMAVYFTAPDDVPEDQARWELEAPIAGEHEPLEASDDECGIRVIEPHLVASAMHRGPYELIAPTYEALEDWTTANGFTVAGPPSEIYLSDPADTPPDEYLTEVRFPVSREAAAPGAE